MSSITHPEQIQFKSDRSGSVTRNLADKLSDSLNFKDVGGKCDGVTDDYAALAAYIASLGSAQGNLNVTGPSVIGTSINIPNNLMIRFEGTGAFTGAGVVTFSGDYIAPHHYRLLDNATFANSMYELDHYSPIANAYGLDIQNYADNGAAPTPAAGAETAIVIHQYSDRAPAMQIDNTRSAPFIRFKEASNPVNSAGTQGTGDFFDFWGYTTGSPSVNLSIGRLNNLLAFISNDVSRPWTFQSGTTAASLQINQANAGVGLNMSQTGGGNAVAISHSGAAHGVNLTTGAGADGFFPLLISGRTNGASITTSLNGAGQNVLQLAHNGTGAGDCLILINKGTGKGVNLGDGTNNLWWLDSVGKQNVRTGGAADTAGRAVLVAGTKTVSTTAVTANSVILLTAVVGGGTIGVLQVGTIVAGTSFVINSVQPGTASTLQAADTSTVAWHIIN